MAFRFWRRIKVAPGVTLNLSKAGGSLSFGPRGSKVTVGGRGRRATVGVPGTGLFYTQKLQAERESTEKGEPTARRRRERPRTFPGEPDAPTVRKEDRLTLGFFKRLLTPDDEEALVDGCRELVLGHEEKALEYLERAVHLADGAYLAGFLALKKKRLEDAANYLTKAAEKPNRLGRYFSRYDISPVMSLLVTDEVTVHVGPDLRGVLLGLVEVYQRLERWDEAIACLERLRRLEPDDVVVKLSLAELLMEVRPGDRDAFRRVVRLAEGIGNETSVHAALLLYKARALRLLGLPDAARETLTVALRRKKGRTEDLMKALRYERARTYDDLGQRQRARKELEGLYAEDPDYEDVAARLGL